MEIIDDNMLEITTKDQLMEAIEMSVEEVSGSLFSPAAIYLSNTNENYVRIDEKRLDSINSVVAKLIFNFKRSRSNI